MNKFCILQTETSCSNRSLTHPTAIISSILKGLGTNDFISGISLPGGIYSLE